MDTEGISLVKQGYIEAIHELCRESGAGTGTKAIAIRLGVKMPSVTQSLKRLAGAGLVDYIPRREVRLTAQGMKLASNLQRKHEILERFFKRIGCPPSKAARIACLVEHDIDMELAERIDRASIHTV